MKKLLFLCTALFAFPVFAQTLVEIKTSQGLILVELDEKNAPQTSANFLNYVKRDFYNGTIFHRVIPGFMIQGGGFDKNMVQKATDKPVINEAKNGLKNKRGTIAMARTNEPHSATAQFFINLVDNDNLNYPSFDGWGYCVFGRVIDGMDVVDKIASVPTGNFGHHQNVPTSPVVIGTIQITKKPDN